MFAIQDLPLERIEHEIEQIAAQVNAGTARWLELVAEFDRREGWGQWGCSSCAEWISWRCALEPRAAREHVRVARRLGDLPRIAAIFGRGELSYSKTRALTRVASPETEEELIVLASEMTAAQLERALQGYKRVTDLEAEESRRACYVSWFWEDDGSLCVSARLPADDGALFLKALAASRRALRDETVNSGGPAGPDSSSETDSSAADQSRAGDQAPEDTHPPPSNVEAFASMAETVLANGPTELRGGERQQVIVHFDVADEHGSIEDGPSIAPGMVKRIGCDAALTGVVERNGKTLSVGRRTRSVPAPMRRALSLRDRGCRFPGCERRMFTDAHHIEHWAHGGETNLENLVLLCRRHHRLVHEGGYSIGPAGEGSWEVRGPDGRVLEPVVAAVATDATRLAQQNRKAGLCIEPDRSRIGSGESVDNALAVDWLLSIVDPVVNPESARGFEP